MFKITKIFILLVVLVAAVIIPGLAASASIESPVRPAKLLSHKYEDVASLQVVGSLHGIKGSPLYQTADETGKATIRKIIDWINSSKPAGVQKDYGRHGYPMVIKIKMNDGKIITVEPGYKCVSYKLSNGNGLKTCSYVKDEIVLRDDSNQIVAKSPELYEWLIKDWKKE